MSTNAIGSKKTGVVVGSQLQPLRRRLFSPKQLLLLGAVVMLVPGIGLSLSLLHKPTVVIPSYDQNAPDDYAVLTPRQIRAKLYHEEGLDINALKPNKISAKTFKDFSQAFATAQAYGGLKDYKTELKVYGIAEGKVDETTTYDFYLKYAAIADQSNNDQVYKQQIEKAKQAIQADDSLSAYLKQDLLDEINQEGKLRD